VSNYLTDILVYNGIIYSRPKFRRKRMYKTRLAFSLVLFFTLVAGCQSGTTPEPIVPPGGNTTTTLEVLSDICDQSIDLGLNQAAAANAPADVSISLDKGITFQNLGVEGAQALVAELTSADTFCSLPVSPAAQEIIDQALGSARAGDPPAGRVILQGLLQSNEASTGIVLVSLRAETGSPRQRIRDWMQAAEVDRALGGDGQAYLDAAQLVFLEVINNDLPGATLKETLGLAQEAIRMGEKALETQARELAEKNVTEILEDAIADFDPCTAEMEKIQVLFKALQQAALLGIPEALGDGSPLFDQVGDLSRMAAQQRFNEAALMADLQEQVTPVPVCNLAGEKEISGEIEIQMLIIGRPMMLGKIPVGRVPFQVLSGDQPSEVIGGGSIQYQGSFALDSESRDNFTVDFTVEISGTYTRTSGSGLLDLIFDFSEVSYKEEIYCPEGLCEVDTGSMPEQTQRVQLPAVDLSQAESGIYTFILHLNP
jgi:hypothetical protein